MVPGLETLESRDLKSDFCCYQPVVPAYMTYQPAVYDYTYNVMIRPPIIYPIVIVPTNSYYVVEVPIIQPMQIITFPEPRPAYYGEN